MRAKRTITQHFKIQPPHHPLNFASNTEDGMAGCRFKIAAAYWDTVVWPNPGLE